MPLSLIQHQSLCLVGSSFDLTICRGIRHLEFHINLTRIRTQFLTFGTFSLSAYQRILTSHIFRLFTLGYNDTFAPVNYSSQLLSSKVPRQYACTDAYTFSLIHKRMLRQVLVLIETTTSSWYTTYTLLLLLPVANLINNLRS